MSEQDCGEDLVELGLLRARVRELEAANVALASESERMTRMVIGYERELCEAGTKLASALEQLRQSQQDAEEMGRIIATRPIGAP